jgi:hypothetical protein
MEETNALANFLRSSVTQKKKFNNVVTCYCYNTFSQMLHQNKLECSSLATSI